MEVESPNLSSPRPKPNGDYTSSVDTSRPFSSVKEAVAIFGHRILTHNSPKPKETELLGTLKKLEAELEETKVELKMLKEKESETEMALATLNSELMSKLAEARIEDDRKKIVVREEERRKEKLFGMEGSRPLVEMLSLEAEERRGYFGSKKANKLVKKKKEKPIVPLVGNLFSKKKGGNNPNSSLYAAPHFYFN